MLFLTGYDRVRGAMDVHSKVIAKFPWSGTILPLVPSERATVKAQVELLTSSFPNMPVVGLVVADSARRNIIETEYKAIEFAEKFIPKQLPVDHTGDFISAWSPRLAATLSYMIGNFSEEKNGPAVLQIGSNYGPLLAFLREELRCYPSGIDSSDEAIKFAHSLGIDFIRQGLAQKIPFESGLLDVVISRHLLCHNYVRAFFPWATENELSVIREEARETDILTPHVLPILREIARVLKPGGIFISCEGETVVQPGPASLFFSKYIEWFKGSIAIIQK